MSTTKRIVLISVFAISVTIGCTTVGATSRIDDRVKNIEIVDTEADTEDDKNTKALPDVSSNEEDSEYTDDSTDDDESDEEGDTGDFVDPTETIVTEVTNSYECYADSVNDKSSVADYKLSDDDFKMLWKFSGVEIGESEDTTYDRTINVGQRYYANDDIANSDSDQDFYQARSWLIENGSLERPFVMSMGNEGIQLIRPDNKDDWITMNNDADKSDLVMMLYKGLYGSEAGRPFVYTAIDESKKVCRYDVYTTSNVYEIYLRDSLAKGLILNSELTDDALKKINLSGTAVWNQSNGAVGRFPTFENGNPTMSMETKDCNSCWGDSYNYNVDESGAIKIQSKQPSYFKSESMTLIDALAVVETFLRYTEKNVTATESDIVAYKYGVEYLSELTEEEYKTVEFLIAKGVLNFEDYNSIGFFETVKWKDLIPIIYRTLNKDARYDFSIIQLTDGEAFWQEKGFSNGSFTLTVPNEGSEYILDTVSTTEESVDVGDNKSNFLFKLLGVSADSKVKRYTVVKDFDTVNSYLYSGVEISKLYDTITAGLATGSPEIVSITKEQVNDIDVYRMTLSIVASNSTRAVQLVDDRISATIKDANVYKITGVLKVKDGKEIRMISKSVLQQYFGDKIDFLEDKVLTSRETGAMACLLPASKYALVGNQVFVDENLLVVNTDGEIYYNFDVISSLLGMSVIKFYSNSVNTQKIASDSKVYEMNLYGSSGSLLGKTEYLAAEVTPRNGGDEYDFDLSKELNSIQSPEYYYNVNQIANGLNTVYRVFYKKFNTSDKKERPYVVVVDWIYAVPDLDDFNTSAILPDESVTGTATWDDVFTSLYTAPTSGTALRAWWDSNLAMSQGLTAMLFDQSNTQFIKCGYMVPKVSVLLPDDVKDEYDGEDSYKKVSELLVESGFKVPSTYKSTSEIQQKIFLLSITRTIQG